MSEFAPKLLVPFTALLLYVVFEFLRRRFRCRREAREREEVLQRLESGTPFLPADRQELIRAVSLWNNGRFREQPERQERFRTVLNRRRDEMVRLTGAYVETLRLDADEQGDDYPLGKILLEVLSHAYLDLDAENDDAFFEGVYRYLEGEPSDVVWWELLDGTQTGREYGPALQHYEATRRRHDSLADDAPAVTDALVQEKLTTWSARFR